MDGKRFDMLARTLRWAGSRRGVLGGLAALGMTASWNAAESKTRGKHRRKRKPMKQVCLNGQTITTRHKRTLIAQGATAGPCPPLNGNQAACTPGSCIGDAICVNGKCQGCTVVCKSGDPATCGFALQEAIAGTRSTIYVCPGRYVGSFAYFGQSVDIIGAGSGADARTNTILDADHKGRVLRVDPEIVSTLQRLRVVNGMVDGEDGNDFGGGIENRGNLTLTDCAIADNTAPLGGGVWTLGRLNAVRTTFTGNESIEGGGLNVWGNAVLANCTFSGNQGSLGGAIYNLGSSTIQDTAITGNEAARLGGGVFNIGGAAITGASTISGNTANQDGGGIYVQTGRVTVERGVVTGNTPNNCAGQIPLGNCVEA